MANLTVGPQLVGIGGGKSNNKHIINVGVNFVAQPVVNVPIPGAVIAGSSYVLNVSSLATQTPEASSLPAIRAALVRASFLDQSGGFIDGSVFLYVPQTGHCVELPCPVNPDIAGVGGAIPIVTALVPIIANSPTNIVIAKGKASDNNMYGIVTVSFYDFDVAPFYGFGFSQSGA